MKLYLSIFLFFALSICKAQITFNEYKFPQVNWRLKVPSIGDGIQASRLNSILKHVSDSMSRAKFSLYDFRHPRVMFNYRQDDFNMFVGIITIRDSQRFKTSHDGFEVMIPIIIRNAEKNRPYLRVMDSTFSTETIDKVDFDVFYFTAFDPKIKKTIYAYLFYTQQNQFDLSINIISANLKTVGKYLELIRASKFDP